jgi:MoxR-like ATPase
MQKLKRLEVDLNKVIIGKQTQVHLILATLLAKGHILLEDIPGTGKTTLAKGFAALIGGKCNRMQFTPDVLPMDVLGGSVFNPNTNEFRMEKGPIFCNIFLGDEINRASPRTQSSLLESMAERQATLEGKSYPLEDFFIVLATQNNFEFEGVFPLPEAQLDRFMIQIEMGYLTPAEEVQMIIDRKVADPLNTLEQILTTDELLEHQQNVTHIHIDPILIRYMVDLANKSRTHTDIKLGLSPRAVLLWTHLAQALAYLAEQSFVNPAHIQQAFVPICTHRVQLEEDTVTQKNIILQEILHSLPVPL